MSDTDPYAQRPTAPGEAGAPAADPYARPTATGTLPEQGPTPHSHRTTPHPTGGPTTRSFEQGPHGPGPYGPGSYGPGSYGSYGSGPYGPTPPGQNPPPGTWPPENGAPGSPPARPRRGRPIALVAGALAALLVAGGVGGAVGYEAASSGAGSSVLASAPSSSSGSPAAAPAGSVEQVAGTVLPSVVQLRGPSGEGSGIVISADGLILTNNHVLEAGQTQAQSSPLGGLLGGDGQSAPQSEPQGLTALFQNGSSAPVQVVGTDPSADLAVVRAQGATGLTPVQLGNSSQLQVGQEVVAVGSPLGLSGTVTSGIVSALQRPVASGGAQSGQATVLDAIQTDAAINPGNSGGALVDMQGRVVGITSAIASLGQSSGGQSGGQSGSIGLGFAIPIDQAARIGNQLATQGFATRAVLGVGVADANPTGATLGQVAPGGAAANAGLRDGDVVTRVDDRLIPDADSLVAAIRSEQPGATVTMTVSTAGGAPRPVPVALGTERSS